VVHGFSWVDGIDYDETFALVARYLSMRFILGLLTQMGWKTHLMDVKKTFLNGMIEEEIYIEHTEGFETFNHESHVHQFKRVFYGLKQTHHAWNTRIDNYVTRCSKCNKMMELSEKKSLSLSGPTG